MVGAKGAAQRRGVVPAGAWVAHLALVLAAFGLTLVLARRGYSTGTLISLGTGVVLAAAFGTQALIAYRAHQSPLAVAGLLSATAGAVFMVWSRTVPSLRAVAIIGGIATAFFMAAIVMSMLVIRQRKRNL